MVSPSVHDGTPNSLLEALACECFPVAGNIESIREWIKDGENGLLFDPENSDDIANTIIHALSDEKLRINSAKANSKLISDRADYPIVMKQVEAFYERIAAKQKTSSQ
jgi:glycosyltransferase involved in cell wall biosynthesis